MATAIPTLQETEKIEFGGFRWADHAIVAIHDGVLQYRRVRKQGASPSPIESMQGVERD